MFNKDSMQNELIGRLLDQAFDNLQRAVRSTVLSSSSCITRSLGLVTLQPHNHTCMGICGKNLIQKKADPQYTVKVGSAHYYYGEDCGRKGMR